MLKNIIFSLSAIVLFCSCKNKEQEKIEIEIKEIIDNVIGEELFLPNNMKVYRPFKDYKLDSVEILSAKLKIVTFINASCGSCISEINQWEKFSNELTKNNIPIMLVFESNDDFELLHYLCESGTVYNSSFPFFLDKEDEYLKNNSFMKKTKSMRTVLVDRENKVLLVGNPMKSVKIKKMYLEEIKRIVNWN